MMKHSALCLLIPILTTGCGSSPASPTAVAVTDSPRVLGFSLQLVSREVLGLSGFAPPTTATVTVGVTTGAAPGSVERSTFRMLDVNGVILSEVVSSMSLAIPAADGAAPRSASVQGVLDWPIQNGIGKKVEVTLDIRLANGELTTVTIGR